MFFSERRDRDLTPTPGSRILQSKDEFGPNSDFSHGGLPPCTTSNPFIDEWSYMDELDGQWKGESIGNADLRMVDRILQSRVCNPLNDLVRARSQDSFAQP